MSQKLLSLLGLLLISKICSGLPVKTDIPRAKTYRVRTGTDMCHEELQAIHARLPHVKKSLERLLGSSISSKHVPHISIACSGGGFRAMITATGFMRGLEKIGVLDSTLYFATLSGSAWMSASWLAQNISLDDFRVFLRKRVSVNVFEDNIDFAAITKDIEKKFYYGQHVSLVDIYGAILGHFLFDTIVENGQKVYLSDLAPKIATGSYPIPLYTSVIDYASDKNYDWFEFTPYEAGCHQLNAWVPITAFGKKFDAGISTDHAPEQTFGYLMGICGSAFAVNIKAILHELEMIIFKKLLLKSSINSWVKFLKEFRLSPAQVFNFTKNMPKCGFSHETYYTLVDSGFAFNIPIPPLLRRSSDIIIIGDASADTSDNNAPALRGAENYAHEKDIPFPPINHTGIKKKQVSVFYDEKNHEAPLIIYFPNQVAFPTSKFDYSKAEFDKLSDTLEKTVIANKEIIVNAIKTKMRQLKN